MRGTLVFAVGLVTLVGCGPDIEMERLRRTVQAEYDPQTGRLSKITYDSNDDGNVDTWTYMDGTRVVRVEIDRDQDGMLDRWEDYDEAGVIQRIGLSRVNDGRPDAWIFPDGAGQIARIEISTRRDDVVDRWEWYEQGALVRAEEDADRDGRPDKWDTYRDCKVASAAFDEDGDGTPDRRLSYGAEGQLVTIERAPDAKGHFTETITVEGDIERQQHRRTVGRAAPQVREID